MEIREIENEVKEQQDDTADIALEVEQHRRHAEQLEVAVHALLEAQSTVDSEGVRKAIDHATEATYATYQRVQELREQRDSMLERNTDLSNRCATALDRKRKALEHLPHLHWGHTTVMPADPKFSIYTSMEDTLRESIDRVGRAHADLADIRRRLEGLEL
ncbi:MAG: hypothetical protein KGL39_43710 [Patescibacteria group bacterium]|nr:hypothetical protein [Patescibacteria group bacterium]